MNKPLATAVLWIFAFGTLALGLRAVARAAAPGGSIEEVIEREQPASGAPGLAYAVMIDGEITTLGAHGVVQLGSSEQVTPDTPFASGSISKSFTALAVMQLVEAGEVDLDAELSLYLKAFSGQPAGAITIRQLLGHTSGLSTLQGNMSHVDGAGFGDDLKSSVEHVVAVSPAYPPGSTWEYSNLNYQLLGRVIEVVSGRDYHDYVDANILARVGMKHSFAADGEVHEEMANGHLPWFGSKYPITEKRTHRSSAPQGGIVASASDLARYMQIMVNGEDDVLSAKGKAAMMQPASPAAPLYGFGWFLAPDDGTVWHSGSTPGVETLLTIRPRERTGVVVLVNSGSGLGFGESTRLINGISALALGTDYEGDGGRWMQKLTFIGLVIAPLIYVLCMFWAWRARDIIRAKSGAFGVFSLWFPLLTTLVAAVFIFGLVPRIFGVSLGTLRLFQPDLVVVLSATGVMGVVWAVFRLGVAYSGKAAQA